MAKSGGLTAFRRGDLWWHMRIGVLLGTILCAAPAGPAEGAPASSAVPAKAIGGQFTAAFEGFTPEGLPKVRLKLQLSCRLTCPPSAPQLTYGVNGGADAFYVSAPKEKVGYISAGLVADVVKDGFSEVVTTSIPAGVNFTAIARSATCKCGNRTGEGGYIDLVTPAVAIPPWLMLAYPAKSGEQQMLLITARPRGEELIEVRLSGCGVDGNRTLTKSDYAGKTTVPWTITPTSEGVITAVAVLQPAGGSHTFKFVVASPK